MFKIVWLELLSTPLSIHTSLLPGRLSIGCLFNTIQYLRLLYWCTNSNIVVTQSILCVALNLDIVLLTHIKAKLMVCSLRSHTMPLQYINPLSILASALLMMLLLSTHSQRSSKPFCLHKHIQPNFFLVSLCGADPSYVSG